MNHGTEAVQEQVLELGRRWAATEMSGDVGALGALLAESFRTKVLLRSEQSDGQVAVIEDAVPAGWEGPPLHYHDFDEAFYVLDGELTFEVNGELATARRGELAFAPRGSHHTLANLSGAAARYLLVCTPAGFERYFDRRVAEQAGTAPPPEASKPIPERFAVGPPIGQRLVDSSNRADS